MTRRSLPLWIAALTALMLAHHALLWLLVQHEHGGSWTSPLSSWDSGWYTEIATQGYGGKRWVFFPLYPLLCAAAATLVPASVPMALVGTVLSTIFFLGFVAVVARLNAPAGLAPQTPYGWLLAVYAPASYAYHSHHTEALFVLASLLAFLAASRNRILLAALLAGACALTRNQGVFVAVAVAFQLAAHRTALKDRLKVFALAGLVSGAVFALYPLYQYLQTGNALTAWTLQREWGTAHSARDVALALVPYDDDLSVRDTTRIAFYLCEWAGVWLLSRRSGPLALYAGLSLAVTPLQGTLMNAFRYGTVLFPVLFTLGDWLARRPLWLRALLTLAVVFLSHDTARRYALGRWAY